MNLTNFNLDKIGNLIAGLLKYIGIAKEKNKNDHEPWLTQSKLIQLKRDMIKAGKFPFIFLSKLLKIGWNILKLVTKILFGFINEISYPNKWDIKNLGQKALDFEVISCVFTTLLFLIGAVTQIGKFFEFADYLTAAFRYVDSFVVTITVVLGISVFSISVIFLVLLTAYILRRITYAVMAKLVDQFYSLPKGRKLKGEEDDREEEIVPDVVIQTDNASNIIKALNQS